MAEEKEWKGQKRTAAIATFREVINNFVAVFRLMVFPGRKGLQWIEGSTLTNGAMNSCQFQVTYLSSYTELNTGYCPLVYYQLGNYL